MFFLMHVGGTWCLMGTTGNKKDASLVSGGDPDQISTQGELDVSPENEFKRALDIESPERG